MNPAEPIRELVCRCGRMHFLLPDAAGGVISCPYCRDILYVPQATSQPCSILPVAGEGDGASRLTPDKATETRAGMLLTSSEVDFASKIHIEDAPTFQAIERTEERLRRSHLVRELAWNLLLFTDPRNLPRLILIWTALGLEALVFLLPTTSFVLTLGIFGIAYALILECLLVSYLARMLSDTVEGRDDLPTVEEMLDGWPRELIEPPLLFGAGSVITFGPALIVWMTAQSAAAPDTFPPVAMIAVTGILLLLGLMFWPMSMLIAIMGHPLDLLRIDVMARAIRATFGAYLRLVVFVLVLGVAGIGGMVALFAWNPPLVSGPLTVASIFATLRTVVQPAIVRAIGAYGRYYREKLPWDWDG